MVIGAAIEKLHHIHVPQMFLLYQITVGIQVAGILQGARGQPGPPGPVGPVGHKGEQVSMNKTYFPILHSILHSYLIFWDNWNYRYNKNIFTCS